MQGLLKRRALQAEEGLAEHASDPEMFTSDSQESGQRRPSFFLVADRWVEVVLLQKKALLFGFSPSVVQLLFSGSNCELCGSDSYKALFSCFFPGGGAQPPPRGSPNLGHSAQREC